MVGSPGTRCASRARSGWKSICRTRRRTSARNPCPPPGNSSPNRPRRYSSRSFRRRGDSAPVPRDVSAAVLPAAMRTANSPHTTVWAKESTSQASSADWGHCGSIHSRHFASWAVPAFRRCCRRNLFTHVSSETDNLVANELAAARSIRRNLTPRAADHHCAEGDLIRQAGRVSRGCFG